MDPQVWYNYERIIPTNIQKANNFDTVFKVNPSQSNFKFRWCQPYFSHSRLLPVMIRMEIFKHLRNLTVCGDL